MLLLPRASRQDDGEKVMRWTKEGKWYTLFDSEWDRRMNRLAAIIADDASADEIEEFDDDEFDEEEEEERDEEEEPEGEEYEEEEHDEEAE